MARFLKDQCGNLFINEDFFEQENVCVYFRCVAAWSLHSRWCTESNTCVATLRNQAEYNYMSSLIFCFGKSQMLGYLHPLKKTPGRVETWGEVPILHHHHFVSFLSDYNDVTLVLELKPLHLLIPDLNWESSSVGTLDISSLILKDWGNTEATMSSNNFANSLIPVCYIYIYPCFNFFEGDCSHLKMPKIL